MHVVKKLHRTFSFRQLNICVNLERAVRACDQTAAKRLLSSVSYGKQSQPVIFSGIQPTGIPHIGNYLGAIKYWVSLQEEPGEIYYSIVDLHSITFPKDRSTLRSDILDMTACLLACGVDPKRSILFQQSAIAEHALLSWVLGCVTSHHSLRRLPQWKEKSAMVKESASLGLYSYPVLQTADILLYKATHVPAGEDQAVHMVLTNCVARDFNKFYGNIFPQVEMLSDPSFARVRSLRDPTSKMSKSAVTAKGRVELTATDDVILERIKKAVTDCTSEVTYDPEERPGVANLIQIHSGFSGMSPEEICRNAKGQDTGQYKYTVADTVIKYLRPIREQFVSLRGDESHLRNILKSGRDRAKETASKNWNEIRQAIGMEL